MEQTDRRRSSRRTKRVAAGSASVLAVALGATFALAGPFGSSPSVGPDPLEFPSGATVDEVGSAPSAQFPQGISLRAAYSALYAAQRSGQLPPSVEVVAPLAPGKVVAPATGAAGVRISLAAPFGFDPGTRAVLGPLLERESPRAEPMSERELKTMVAEWRASGTAVPSGWRVALPVIFDCQVDAPGMPSVCPPDTSSAMQQGVWLKDTEMNR